MTMINWDAMLSGGDWHQPTIRVGRQDAGQVESLPLRRPDAARVDDWGRGGDDRRSCDDCSKLATNGRCLAAARGELLASRSYAPDSSCLRRCECFEPLLGDADQRVGRVRWPGL